jgi:hypothetical protein
VQDVDARLVEVQAASRAIPEEAATIITHGS